MPRSPLSLARLFLLGAVLATLPPPAAAQPALSDSARSMRAEAAFVRGLTAELLGDPARAVQHFGEALALAGDQLGILSALADAHADLDQSDEALFYAERAVQADPASRDATDLLASFQMQRGEPAAAAAAYRALLAFRPDDGALWLELAEAEERAGDPNAALAAYDRLQAITGPTLLILSRRLRLYGRLDRPDDVIAALEQMAELEPDSRDLQMRLGLTYLRQERYEDAVRVFSALQADDPADPEPAFRLAETYDAMGRTDDAEAVRASLSEGAASGDPEDRTRYAAGLYVRSGTHPEAAAAARRALEALVDDGETGYEIRVMLGDLLLRSGEPAAAAVQLDAALADNPRDAQIWAQAVSAHLDAGDRPAALRAAEDGLLLFPGHFPLVTAAAYAAADAGRNRLAQERFADAADLLAERDPNPVLDGERSRLLTMAALMHARLGENAAADQRYADALDADPDNDLALNNYAYALAERAERLDEALDMATRAVQQQPNSPSYLDTLGWVYFQMGRYDEAAAALQSAADAAGPAASATVLEHLGDAEQARGQLDAARAAYRRALEKAPDLERLQRKAGQ